MMIGVEEVLMSEDIKFHYFNHIVGFVEDFENCKVILNYN
jgi:hypothetical protein